MRENGNGWECDWLWYLSRTRFQSFITENEWAILQISFWSECGMIRHMFYIRWIIDADKNRVINRVDQYCELQWDICVIEWMMLYLFSDFHSLTFLITDELRICYKLINQSIIHSIIHSIISYWLLSLMKVRMIDWLTQCKPQNQRINQYMNG